MRAPAFQFYPKQWLGDDKVMAMDWDARAMHMHLICIAWQQEPPCTLPDDDAMIRRWLGSPKKWEVLKDQIFAAWKMVDGRWTQSGLLTQFTRQTAYSETRKANAEKRWNKDAHASEVQCTDDALQSSTSSSTAKPIKNLSSAKKKRKVQNAPPCKTDINKARHKEFKAAIGLYWKGKNPGVDMPWGPPEGMNLEVWLRESPNTSIDQFTAYLRNRFKSDVNHTERPSVWIRNVAGYAIEPLDKFGKPKSLATRGASNGFKSNAEKRQDFFLETLNEQSRRGDVLELAGGSETGADIETDAGGLHPALAAIRARGHHSDHATLNGNTPPRGRNGLS